VGLVVAAASTHRLIVIFPLLQGNNAKNSNATKKHRGKKSARPQHFTLRNNPQKQQLLHQHIG